MQIKNNRHKKMTYKKYISLAGVGLLLIIIVVSYFYHFRIDLTSEKRYTVSAQTKELMKKTNGQLNVTVYLDGDLNPGFIRLKKSSGELLDELSVHAAGSLHGKPISNILTIIQYLKDLKMYVYGHFIRNIIILICLIYLQHLKMNI